MELVKIPYSHNRVFELRRWGRGEVMLPLRNGGAGFTVGMKLNLPVVFLYCYGTLLMFLSYCNCFAGDKSCASACPTSFLCYIVYCSSKKLPSHRRKLESEGCYWIWSALVS